MSHGDKIMEQYYELYVSMVGEPTSAKPEDESSLAQPDIRRTVRTVTTYGTDDGLGRVAALEAVLQA